MAGLVRSESYPLVLSVELCEAAPFAGDLAPCEVVSSESPWTCLPTSLTPARPERSALRPGAERFTCNGGILAGYEQQAPEVPGRFVRLESGAPIAPPKDKNAQPTLWARPSDGAAIASPVGPIASPFSTFACQLLHGDAEAKAKRSLELRPVDNASAWQELNFGSDPTCGASAPQQGAAPALGGAYVDWPASPARHTTDDAAAMVPPWFNVDAFMQWHRGHQQQDALRLIRPAFTRCEHNSALFRVQSEFNFSEHPCTLIRAHSGGGENGKGDAEVAAGLRDAAAQQLGAAVQRRGAVVQQLGAAVQQLVQRYSDAAASIAEPCEASTSAPVEACGLAPALSSQSSMGRNSGMQTAPCVGAETEVVSAACAPAAAAEPLTGDFIVKATRALLVPAPADDVQGARMMAAPTQVLASGRGHKRRAAATAAAAVVEVTARDEDEDYLVDGFSGDASGRGAKRMKKGGAVRQPIGKLVRGGVTCRNCGATQTPQWRCGPDGPRTLCNACGVRHKKGLPLAYKERTKRQIGGGAGR